MKKIGQSLSLIAKAFFGVYIFIYSFPFPASYIPYGYPYFSKHIDWLKAQLNLFFANHLFGFKDIIYNPMNGSGDTTLDYVALVSYSTVALIIALILFISLKDRSKINTLYRYLLVYARYFVGLTLISYGIVKFLVGQFPGPSYFALESTFGEFSPMGLAWRFFGYSDLYKGFMGVAEIMAGLLIMVRKTQVLGALICIAVTTNIFLVNLAFDVPVKLFSGHLLFFSMLVLFPYLKALTGLFLLNKPAHLPDLSYSFNKKWKKVVYVGTKVILILLLPIALLIGHVSGQKMMVYLNEWEGVYEVQSIEPISEKQLDSLQNIEKIVIQGKSIMTIDSKKEKRYYTIDNIWNEGEINFIRNHDQEDPHTIKIIEKENQDFILNLNMYDTTLDFHTKRKLKEDYLLVNRGFRWVNESPFNK